MTTLEDKDVVSLVRIALEIAEVMLESLVRKGIFDHSDIEFFMTDVHRAVAANVNSENARATIGSSLSKMSEELSHQVEVDHKFWA